MRKKYRVEFERTRCDGVNASTETLLILWHQTKGGVPCVPFQQSLMASVLWTATTAWLNKKMDGIMDLGGILFIYIFTCVDKPLTTGTE